MRRIIPKLNQNTTFLASLFLLFSFLFSTSVFSQNCGNVTGYVFTDGVTSIPINHDQTYDINALPTNFYFKALVDGFSESASIKIRNLYANSEFVVEDNNMPYTYPSNQQSWDIGPAEFEIKTRIYEADNISGSKCDELNLKFTLFDSSIPDCGCNGGIFSLTFNYPGNEVLTVNNGEITNNGDGSYTLTKGGLAISDPEISINGNQIAKIHTSCSKNLLGVVFPEGIVIVAYLDSQGTYSNIDTGCTSTTSECGQIAGFEFSNGNTSVAITNDGEYALNQLPNNFYVNVLVNGYSESASIKVKNEDTGQEFTIGENVLPYTFPAGNGAWNLPAGEYKVEAKIFKFDNCAGSYCDSDYIKFTITNTPSCGQIDGLAFSNGTNSVNIANGGSYDISSLPYNFYVDVVVSGMTESAFNRVTNLDTGAVYTNGENVLPYTYPSGNQAWTLGTGTFQFYSEIFKYDNCAGTKCDHICITFTILEDTCGNITEFQFANGTDPVTTIVDGGIYNIDDLPSDFYIDGIVSGNSDSVRFEVTNNDTGEEYNIIENYIPYTFPAGNGAWFLGTGSFTVKGSLFTGNYCNGTLCDEDTITFILEDGVDELCDAEAGTTDTDGSIFLITTDNIPRVEVTPGPNAVLPTGYDYCTVISTGPNTTIVSWESGLSAELTQAGEFRVHLAVYNPLTLDLNTIVPGTTTAADILNTVAENNICASLDDIGTEITVIVGGVDERSTNVDTKDPIKTTVNEPITVVERIEDIVEDTSVDIKLYPNPVVNDLNVELLLLDTEVMQYNVYDLNGRQVLSGSFDNSTFGKTKMNTKSLSTGLYVVKFESNFRSFSKKIQVSK